MRWKVASPSVNAPDSAGNKRWVIFFLTALELKIRPPELCAFLQVESIQSHCIFKSLTNQDWVLIQSKLPLNPHLVHFPVLIVVESSIEQLPNARVLFIRGSFSRCKHDLVLQPFLPHVLGQAVELMQLLSVVCHFL